MDFEKLKEALESEPAFRLKQCRRAVYGEFVDSWKQATNLPKGLIEALEKSVPLAINAEIFESRDKKTAKALVTLEDGNKIEAVLMRHNDGRNTVCVSSQAGCGMGCDFCATGKLGLKRNLTTSEIIDQVIIFERYLKPSGQRVTNVVFMGMGEPMANFENVMAAIKILNDKDSFNIGARRISVSTCGIIGGIKRLAEFPLQVNLAVSLHAPNTELRSRIMPINKSFNIDRLMRALNNYLDKTGRKIMIEYVLLKGVNDSGQHAKELADLLKKSLGGLFMVNLIPYNKTEKYNPPDGKDIFNFKAILENTGIEVSQRHRFGHDIEGACGQLAAKS
ncbi:MAG: 23S rRNA (adenine(2503)-C(2))-methyltransferase RlmN [Candidatus Peregrinibacteria bacterium]